MDPGTDRRLQVSADHPVRVAAEGADRQSPEASDQHQLTAYAMIVTVLIMAYAMRLLITARRSRPAGRCPRSLLWSGPRSHCGRPTRPTGGPPTASPGRPRAATP